MTGRVPALCTLLLACQPPVADGFAVYHGGSTTGPLHERPFIYSDDFMFVRSGEYLYQVGVVFDFIVPDHELNYTTAVAERGVPFDDGTVGFYNVVCSVSNDFIDCDTELGSFRTARGGGETTNSVTRVHRFLEPE